MPPVFTTINIALTLLEISSVIQLIPDLISPFSKPKPKVHRNVTRPQVSFCSFVL